MGRLIVAVVIKMRDLPCSLAKEVRSSFGGERNIILFAGDQEDQQRSADDLQEKARCFHDFFI